MTPARRWTMDEDDWKSRVIGTAIANRWRVHHSLPAPTADGKRWKTHVEGHTGLPDLVLARAGVVLLPELKLDDTYPSPEQRAWLAELGDHGAIWRPRDWDHVLARLTRKAPA